jgi:excisionase family DNA binding protein
VAKLLSVAEVARRLKRNPVLVYRWIDEGRLRAQKVGRAVIVDERDVEQFAKQQPERRRRGGQR